MKNELKESKGVLLSNFHNMQADGEKSEEYFLKKLGILENKIQMTKDTLNKLEDEYKTTNTDRNNSSQDFGKKLNELMTKYLGM